MFYHYTFYLLRHLSSVLRHPIFPVALCFIWILESIPVACVCLFCTFYYILYYSWTHHSGHCGASCFLSREWQITPSGSDSLWSPLHVAATIIPCATFKHIPFALQFVQPGIITTPLCPPPALPNPVLLHPSGSVLPLAFSAPSRVAFCSFHVQSVFILAKKQSVEARIPHCNSKRNFVHIKGASVGYMHMQARYGFV